MPADEPPTTEKTIADRIPSATPLFTPGEWTLLPGDLWSVARLLPGAEPESLKSICQCLGPGGWMSLAYPTYAELIVNRRLIAAAPKLHDLVYRFAREPAVEDHPVLKQIAAEAADVLHSIRVGRPSAPSELAIYLTQKPASPAQLDMQNVMKPIVGKARPGGDVWRGSAGRRPERDSNRPSLLASAIGLAVTALIVLGLVQLCSRL